MISTSYEKNMHEVWFDNSLLYNIYIYNMYIYIYIFVCVCVCVCKIEWLLFYAKQFFQLYQVYFQWIVTEIRFVLDQHAGLDFYNSSSLKQQSADKHVAPLWHVILIPSQQVFALTLECCVLSEEAT
jgi:hypothetical protein